MLRRLLAMPLEDLSDRHFPNAKKIVLVQDNLNTHKPASLYEAFPAYKARRLVERFEWHYTPKHVKRTACRYTGADPDEAGTTGAMRLRIRTQRHSQSVHDVRPLEGWRRVKVTDRRTAVDYAQASLCAKPRLRIREHRKAW
jgi:hypothetical protein